MQENNSIGDSDATSQQLACAVKRCLIAALVFITFFSARAAAAQQTCAGASAIDGVPYYVGQLYADILKRAPDAAGQVYHITTLEGLNTTSCNSADPTLAAGNCEWSNNAQTANDFLMSPESVGLNGALTSNADFVNAMYGLFLRRAADNAGFNYYLSLLNSGTSRLNVVSMFVSSPEYRERFACTYNGHPVPLCDGAESIDPVPSLVSQLYLDILDRPADGIGQEWWTNYTSTNLQNMCRNTAASTYSTCDHVIEAQTVLQFFQSSAYAKSNPSISDNGAFITALYKHLLQRPPDQPGLTFYTNYLDQTKDRIGTIQAFRTSDEYRKRFSCYAGYNNQLNFGINGHPFSHTEYSNTNGVTYSTQMSLLQSAYLTWYRTDIYVATTGNDFSNMDLMLSTAQAAGVQLLPVINPVVDLSESLDQLYSDSYTAAYTLVSRYKSSIHVWELANEQDVYSLYEPGDPWGNGKWPYGPPPGDSLTDYYPPRLAIAEAIIHGLADGARAADPTCIRIVNFAWIHTGFIEHLEDDAIPYDVIGVHWYSNFDSEQNTGMGDITCPGQDLPCTLPLLHFNVIDRMHKLTNGKPLWVTETNYWPIAGNTVSTNITWEENYLPPTLQVYLASRATYPFQVLIMYELLDEPTQSSGGPFFDQMGLYEDTLNSNGTVTLGSPKPAYTSVQQILAP